MNYTTTITHKGDVCDISGQYTTNTIDSSVKMAMRDANIKFDKSENTVGFDTFITIINQYGFEIYTGRYNDLDLDHLVVTGRLSPKNHEQQYPQPQYQ